jgi:hypothetical protein
VGDHRFGMLTFLYDYVCDNRMVHGAREVKALSIRHTKDGPERFAKEALPILRAYAESSVREVEAELHRATLIHVKRTDEEIMDWLHLREFSKKESEGIIQLAKVEEGHTRTVCSSSMAGPPWPARFRMPIPALPSSGGSVPCFGPHSPTGPSRGDGLAFAIGAGPA